ncbi:hypothetical protein B0H67DRAFT_325970 [Lasiosphaeris hirsuta]|uniref:Uncharacterized protein n=1 Tax=Lasiosphaeris hirsuta TaxID=260670 RepID=A0AA40DLX0_9PEZI|nr:hypothetical protein B0H67DRAFT_325970 [Lasiosphaeris hirsuta]
MPSPKSKIGQTEGWSHSSACTTQEQCHFLPTLTVGSPSGAATLSSEIEPFTRRIHTYTRCFPNS